jgi:hypothetical protein
MCGITKGRHIPNFQARNVSVLLSYVGRKFPTSEVKTWTKEEQDQATEWAHRCLRTRPEPPPFLKPENCVLLPAGR